MSYQSALEAAGAKVLAFEQFGSYQGDWWAKVRYNGEEGWINGSYGSCSGCDAFEAEFGYGDQLCSEHEYEYDKTITDPCPKCTKVREGYQQKLSDFGKGYLDTIRTQEEAIKIASEHLDWDSDAPQMVAYIKEH